MLSFEITEHERGYAFLNKKGSFLRTPADLELVVPTKTLADLVHQEAEIHAGKRFFTPLCLSALDRVSTQRQDVIDQLLAYVHSDALCYRAEHPDSLVKQQIEEWTPYLNWVRDQLGVQLMLTEGIMPLKQPEEVVSAFREKLSLYDDYHLAGMLVATQTLVSIVLALALQHRDYPAEHIHQAAILEERFQLQQWGEDPELQKRLDAHLDSVLKLDQYFQSL